MRMGPIGIAFRNAKDDVLFDAVKGSIVPTHVHPEAIEGAWVQAKIITLLLKENPETFNSKDFMTKIVHQANVAKMEKTKEIFNHLLTEIDMVDETKSLILQSETWCNFINSIFSSEKEKQDKEDGKEYVKDIIVDMTVLEAICGMKFQINAINSIGYVLWIFLRYYKTPFLCICHSVSLGGDTDTIAGMVGAYLGALYGFSWIPKLWFNSIENGQYGRDMMVRLAIQLSLLDLDFYSFHYDLNIKKEKHIQSDQEQEPQDLENPPKKQKK